MILDISEICFRFSANITKKVDFLVGGIDVTSCPFIGFSLSLILNAYKAEEDLDSTREGLNPSAGLQHGILRPGSGLMHAALN